MTSQPDKLFRDKLENFHRPAPAAAWDRIENNLARQTRKIVWMRVAAGIALLAAATFVLWPAEKANDYVAVKTDPLPVIKKQDEVKQDPITEPAREPVHVESVVANNARPAVKKQPKPSDITPQQEIIPEPVLPATGKHEHIAEVTEPEETAAPIKLVYTTAEVNAKFLRKKLPPEATPENEDASGIQKLIGLAYAAKNSETGLGELRQKKDDLLALGFGKNKRQH